MSTTQGRLLFVPGSCIGRCQAYALMKLL